MKESPYELANIMSTSLKTLNFISNQVVHASLPGSCHCSEVMEPVLHTLSVSCYIVDLVCSLNYGVIFMCLSLIIISSLKMLNMGNSKFLE